MAQYGMGALGFFCVSKAPNCYIIHSEANVGQAKIRNWLFLCRPSKRPVPPLVVIKCGNNESLDEVTIKRTN